jgi:serine/threonine-protein kinase
MENLKARFKREAQITASLRSPHTIELYDFGVTQTGSFYYVMEYLKGLDLDHLVSRFGPLPPGRVIHLMKQAADSLAEAHKKGLIHRDIKPSNLFITRLGLEPDFLKVLDFGLVKRDSTMLDDESKLTNEGITTGTPAYMAPELALGKSEVDSRSDIYALGCVGYWLLTGLLVFEGTTPMEMVVEHVKTPPVPPSERTEVEIPPQLDDLIMACLNKDPDSRPQSMFEVVKLLEECKCPQPWTRDRADSWWSTHLPNVA